MIFFLNKRAKNTGRVMVFLLLMLTSLALKAIERERPFILVTPAERAQVLEKIEKLEWAADIYAQLLDRTDKEVHLYQNDPVTYLKQLPFDWSQAKDGEIPPFRLTVHIENGQQKNLDNATDEEWRPAALLMRYLQVGVNCGMAYYLTEDEKYAQCATDILYAFVQGVLQSEVSDWHPRGGWLFPYDGFREVREIGSKVPLIYDFVAEFIKDGATAYDFAKNENVDFSLAEAQQVFRTYADITINYGHTGSNHSVLEAPSLVYNALAMDDAKERETLLSYFLTENTSNQDAINVMAQNYKEKGDIWPETSQYLNYSTAIVARLMLIVNRYNPSLQLGAKYPNVLYALPRLDYLVYPNQELIRWGDGKRFGTSPYSSFEDAYVLGKMDGLSDVCDKFGPLINRALQEGRYKRRGMEAIFWYTDKVDGDAASFTLDRTDRVPHAGIFLQRNLSSTKVPEDGLMCFVGGAPMVHSHAEGMNIELYGEGQVLGVDNGRGSYAQDIHENYSRIFAAHNTVIVNGSSQGQGGWANLGIDTVHLISMEPLPGKAAVSPNYSFTQTGFEDDRGDKAEATQERTLALIRTSPTTGYYVDVFRSKSRLANEYHDYIYHNIGDKLTIQNDDMSFVPTPQRYMASAALVWDNNNYRNPGWHFFEDVSTSKAYNAQVNAQFEVTQLKGQSLYMQLHIIGFEGREYTTVKAPHTFQAPEPYDEMPTPTLLIRNKGGAWKTPFVVVYEPFSAKEKNPSIQSVEKLEQDGVYKGVRIDSKTPEQQLQQYIITQSKGERYKNEPLGIDFSGAFAVITLDHNGDLQNMYIGEGERLVYGKHVLNANEKGCAYQSY